MARHSVASCAKTCSACLTYSLLLHSYCCLYLVHWLPTPPHCLGSLAGVILFGKDLIGMFAKSARQLKRWLRGAGRAALKCFSNLSS